MRILYTQDTTSKEIYNISNLNLKNCYLKEIVQRNDSIKTSLSFHWHNEYEIHIVISGKQVYEIGGADFVIKENEFILISPKTKHKIVSSSEDLIKYSLTFGSNVVLEEKFLHKKINIKIANCINFIKDEFKNKKQSSAILIENRYIEMLVMLLRISGFKENVVKESNKHVNNRSISAAIQFINDNIERKLTVTDVATYCHVSVRHLTREFKSAERIAPAKYIRQEKMKKISQMLITTELPIKKISEIFSFENEYYFSASFKKYFGVPPIVYRKMHR